MKPTRRTLIASIGQSENDGDIEIEVIGGGEKPHNHQRKQMSKESESMRKKIAGKAKAFSQQKGEERDQWAIELRRGPYNLRGKLFT